LATHADSQSLPLIYLARHGETAWSISRQHTGLTDLPLTERGERNACRLGARLETESFARVLTSPLQRASRTCELSGFGAVARVDEDLVEWNYGDYEGKTSAEIELQCPGWEIFRDGCPGGESVEQVAARADRIIKRLRAADGNSLLFAHGHLLQILAARWVGLEAMAGRYFLLSTTAMNILGYHHDHDDPVIRLWNDCSHAGN
tara:strand:- start:7072 stop:7683 length:612 start_codon:yes stop_codon:yes gene_type:complete